MLELGVRGARGGDEIDDALGDVVGTFHRAEMREVGEFDDFASLYRSGERGGDDGGVNG